MQKSRGFAGVVAAIVIAAAAVGLFFWMSHKAKPEADNMKSQEQNQGTSTAQNVQARSDDQSLDTMSAEIDTQVSGLNNDNNDVNSSFNDKADTLQ